MALKTFLKLRFWLFQASGWCKLALQGVKSHQPSGRQVVQNLRANPHPIIQSTLTSNFHQLPSIILSTLSSNFLQLPWGSGLPLLPPPPRAPGSPGKPHSQAPIFDFLPILVVIVFSSFFQHPFLSILAPSWLPKRLPNPSKIDKKSIQKLDRKSYYFWGRCFMDF